LSVYNRPNTIASGIATRNNFFHKRINNITASNKLPPNRTWHNNLNTTFYGEQASKLNIEN
jgi:hypothetical protein